MSLGPAVQKFLAVAILAALAFFAWTAAIGPALDKFDQYEARTAQSRDLIQRYQRILASSAALKSEIAALRNNRLLRQGLLVAPGAELGAANLQGKIKQTAAAGDAKLISVQVLAAKQEASFTKVGVRARLSGTVSALHGVLYDLETAWPALIIDNVNVRARTRRLRRERGAPATLTVEANLTIRFDAYGFMAATGGATPAPEGGQK
ncbi:MAG: type II secretion system protein GspM [Alphaproteobacteria bacterium]|nr:type II secretion system protein GspM [Alphaproteobacteria bacterium]